MLKKVLPHVVTACAALSIAAAAGPKPFSQDTETVHGFCKALKAEGIIVPAGLKAMELDWGLLQTNFHRMIAARKEANTCGESSVELRASLKERAFSSELRFRQDVKTFAERFER